MLTKIRWKLANLIAPDMAPAAPELRACLLAFYNWTAYKGTPLARRAHSALVAAGAFDEEQARI